MKPADLDAARDGKMYGDYNRRFSISYYAAPASMPSTVSMERDPYYLDQRVARAYDADNEGRDITTGDLPFYLGLAREAAGLGQGVLELACGTGRVTIPTASEGISVVGLDRSPAMLEVARSKTGSAGNPRWIEAEMTGFQLNEQFGLVIIPFRSFMHLTTAAEQKDCLRLVKEHLVESGRLALNFLNPEILPIAGRSTTARRTAPGYSNAKHSLEEEQAVEERLDRDALISRVHRGQRLRYVFRAEMEYLLADAGFEVEELCGWFDHEPVEKDSSELVWVARNLT